jgi:hypothetical protein
VKLAEVGASTKESAEYVVYQPVIEAFNLQRADPAWELRAAPGKQLSGIQLFHMVIRAPKGAQCHALVGIRADIIRQGFLFTYEPGVQTCARTSPSCQSRESPAMSHQPRWYDCGTCGKGRENQEGGR